MRRENFSVAGVLWAVLRRVVVLGLGPEKPRVSRAVSAELRGKD